MTCFYRRLVLLVSCLSMSLVTEASTTVITEGFENKATVITDRFKSLQKLELPESVQSRLHDTDARDMRVVNDDGVAVPMLVKYQKPVAAKEIIKEVVFYPLSETVPAKEKELNSQGEIEINIALRLKTIKQHQAASKSMLPKIYILENPQYKNAEKTNDLENSIVSELQLYWTESFDGIASLIIETSTDLNHWEKISSNNVVDMRFQDQKLSKNTVSLHGSVDRFIRLTWTGEKRPLLNAVKAKLTSREISPAYKWTEPFSMTPVEKISKENNVYAFSVSPSFRSDRIRFVPVHDNSVYSGVMQGSINNKHWHRFADFRFYNIAVNNEDLSLLEKAIHPRGYENWELRFSYPESLNIHEELNIQVSRYPVTVLFLKQGNGPFYLYYGSKNRRTQDASLSNIVADLQSKLGDDIGVAKLGLSEEINPNQKDADQTSDVKKYILWTVMVAGVLLMLLMARGLFKQMQSDD